MEPGPGLNIDQLMGRDAAIPDLVVPAHQETDGEYQQRRIRELEAANARLARDRRSERRAALRTAVREWSWTLVDLAGIALVAYGLFTKWPWLGIVFAGVGLILVSVLANLPTRRAPQEPSPTPPEAGRYEGP